LAAGGGLVLAAVVAVAVTLQSTGGAACAASVPPTGGTAHKGKATFYTLASGGGNCSYVGPPADDLYVALSPGEYVDAAACGGYLDVTGPKGKVRVKIVDQCPECPTGHLDLSRRAFARIADPVQGIVPVTYRAVVNPRLPGPLAFRIKEGASQFWFAVLVVDHGNPLRMVEARSPGRAWKKITRTDYNYWVQDGGFGPGPYSIRVTDVYGVRAIADGIRLAPARVQTTKVSLYGGSAPRTRAPAAPGNRAPGPSRSAVAAGTIPPGSPQIGQTEEFGATQTIDPSAC
jgi:expansin (peptidoglycan-binding protein)